MVFICTLIVRYAKITHLRCYYNHKMLFKTRNYLLLFFTTLLYLALFTCYLFGQTPNAIQQEVTNSDSEIHLDSVFLNSSEIKITDKPVMLVFGKDDCYYCDILSASLMGNTVIQGYILLNFSPYYINLSDKKRHSVPHLNLSYVSSIDIARLYNIQALPLIIFISTESKEIMRISGFPGEKRMIHLLEFINNDIWKNFETPKERVRGFLEYEKQYQENP